ncbi:MAG TPA: alpha-1,4-glucan--maltose-1-phosphate maltosyltransferase [Acidimicrobiales bacterium]|nr:alpha-1,4-glucan--maltose-1-phosphate maltosyltransferase [Acidimicrobiales bacterium]
MNAALSEVQGRARPVIEHVTPQVDSGRFPAKREAGDLVVVEADVFVDGHDELACDVLWRRENDDVWRAEPMVPLVNDRWRGAFPAEDQGRYLFRVRATVDHYGTWLRDVRIKSEAGQDLTVELLVGAGLLTQAATRAKGRAKTRLEGVAKQLAAASEEVAGAGLTGAGLTGAGVAGADLAGAAVPGADLAGAGLAGAGLTGARVAGADLAGAGLAGAGLTGAALAGAAVPGASPEGLAGAPAAALEAAAAEQVLSLVRGNPDLGPGVTSDELAVVADRLKARYSSWYEMFPRSASREPGRHGTFGDVRARLPYVSKLGFDVLYLPPVHPIGRTNRKGRDGARVAGGDDPGSPWAIGGPEGGHTALHPQLGTFEEFEGMVREAARLGIEVALDLAFQCSPDHPWVKEHPEWFRWLPDGTVRYAENPPKRYEDIYPIYFETQQWSELWVELLDVVRFWVRHGIRIFRVDNPHTKPLRFWEWLIAEVQAEHPEVLFLAEAFTRPKVMHHLAKAGFTQSYTYFAWRNTKRELEEYLTELHSTEVADFFRPNFWPNTPDIVTEVLQRGERATFMARLVLAATSAASYGIYGPVYELCEHEPRTVGSEEYLHSEKYEIRHFDLETESSLAGFVARVNEVRSENLVLQHDRNLLLCQVDNDQLISYARGAPAIVPSPTSELDARSLVVVVNLDPHNRQSGWVEIDLAGLGLDPASTYEAHDLLTGASYTWQGPRNFVVLDPDVVPAHILRLGAP